jgi:hypothetical protein
MNCEVKMNKYYLMTLFFVITLFNHLLFCQNNNCIGNVNQFSTGKDKITFYIFDCETNEPLIGAAIYSFNLKKILGMSDIDGVAITEKEIKGNLEISYIGYYEFCFKLSNENIDSVFVRLKSVPWPPDLYAVDTTRRSESPTLKGEFDAKFDLEKGIVQLFTIYEPTEEQNDYADKHMFTFKLLNENRYYRDSYNELVIEYLNKKFEMNIEEELKAICWRIYQP